ATNLAAREQTLHDELQELRSPQHLALAAQAAGMVVPTSACTVRLAAGTTDPNCTPSTRDNAPRLRPRPPKKPAVLNPAPVVVTVPPAAGQAQESGRPNGRQNGRNGQRGGRR